MKLICNGSGECKIKECYNYTPKPKQKGIKLCSGRKLERVK